MPPCEYGHLNVAVEPAQDLNQAAPSTRVTGTANPPIPESERPVTPEFLQELIRELNELRQEQSELYAKMYPMSKPGEVPNRPPYETMEQYKRQDAEYDKKMGGLKWRIQSMRVLLVAQPPAEPELEKIPAPAQPTADAATQTEVQRGSAFPVQRPNEPFTPANPPHSEHLGEAPPVRK